jgi:hypothetical protein
VKTICFFNNCHNSDHVETYGRDAFFDLENSGRQATQASGLTPGQLCVVGSYGDGDQVIFRWYSFSKESHVATMGSGGESSSADSSLLRHCQSPGRPIQSGTKRAQYRCEVPGCRDAADFRLPDVHHMTRLGEGGADHTDNTGALCPACTFNQSRPKLRP